MPNQTDPNQPQTTMPQQDLPPMPQNSQGPASMMTSTPKKKFGGKKIIATVLGFLLLVGGVGTGVYLAQTNQNPFSRAGGGGGSIGCAAGYYACNKGCCKVDTGGGGGGGGCTAGASRSCTVSGCSGVQICNGNSWNSCVKSDPACGSNSGGGSPGGSERGPCTGALNGGCNTGLECVNGKCQKTSSTNLCSAGLIHCNGVCISKSGCPNVSPGGGCSSTGDCTSGYVCDPNTFKCVANTNTSTCGRDQDTGAPVCCTSIGSDLECTTAGGTPSCEAPSRFECNIGGTYCTIQANSPDCGGNGTGTPPPGGGSSASCQNVKAYGADWTLLGASDLSSLAAGDNLNFCVVGSASSGSFDKAKFTINGTTQTETTLQRPSSQDFCQTYTIPSGVTNFNVTAQIHHVTLGWK